MIETFFRLAAIDLDGTLLGPDGRIGQRNRAAVRALADAGVTPIIASGRMHAATLAVHDELGLDTPVVSYNGALVLDPRGNRPLLHVPLDAAIAEEVVSWAAEHDVVAQYYLDDTLYVDRLTGWSRLYHDRTGSRIVPVGPLSRFSGRSPTKILYVGRPEDTLCWQDIWRGRLGDRAYIVRTMPEYLEFLDPRVDKWEGIRVAAQELGVPGERVVAFGDSHNDVPMLAGAGLGVAMPYSPAEVLKAADAIADGSVEDAFGAAVERLLAGEWEPAITR